MAGRAPVADLEVEPRQQEHREGQNEQWLRQEFYVEFTSVLVGAYYADALDRAERDSRIGDYPHRPERPVLVPFDLGVRDATVATYYQVAGEYIHVIDCDEFTGLALAESLSRARSKGYNIDRRGWYAPHDFAQHGLTAGGHSRPSGEPGGCDASAWRGLPHHVIGLASSIDGG